MKKPKLVIRERQVSFPRIPFVGVSLPFNFTFHLPSLEGLDFGKNARAVVSLTLVVSVAVIAASIYFAIRGVNAAPVWPDAAVYDASRAQGLGQEEIGPSE